METKTTTTYRVDVDLGFDPKCQRQSAVPSPASGIGLPHTCAGARTWTHRPPARTNAAAAVRVGVGVVGERDTNG